MPEIILILILAPVLSVILGLTFWLLLRASSRELEELLGPGWQDGPRGRV